jgi:outer membrane protein assembly factor BamB
MGARHVDADRRFVRLALRFVSDDKGAVHALDRTNGRSVWKQDKLAHRRLSLPLPVDNEVVLGDLQGYVHFLSREAGAFVARMPTDGSPVLAAPLRPSDRVAAADAQRRPVRAQPEVKPVIALVGRPNVGKSTLFNA